ncbi:sugar (and other) transporter family protein [Orientia chuto str. Dubai]|uniref:Sugar (And other) transporter family protein n=1 Tax=Orientia chuto str. Dubai TaxID=1359168 RepID=A0A0F3MNH0_9RICK|nr:MFS transporter [Candidatus Orientia mediorientalis]KJV56124.1 sugar (and other) transporter family protein [Orientia chuto str. Dubai]
MQKNALKYNFTVIVLLVFITQLATDIYVPGLPRVASAFNVLEHRVMWTVSSNLIGLALSGLVYGPLSDTIGRKKALLLGIAIFVFLAFFVYIPALLNWLCSGYCYKALVQVQLYQ